MANVYPTVKVYIDNDRDGYVDTDISSKVCSAISGDNGLMTAKDADRLPPSGSVRFDLENKDGDFEDAEQLIGKSVAIRLDYDGREKFVFFGYILHAGMDSGPTLPLHVPVTVVDWLHSANNTRMRSVQMQTLKRADEALRLLTAVTANPPDHEDYDEGVEVFGNVFDASKNTAKVYSELDRIVKSELGYLYLKFRVDGYNEVLRLENRFARRGSTQLSVIPAAGLLKYHGSGGTSGYLKYHGAAGTSGILRVNMADEAIFDKLHYDAEWTAGKLVINEFSISNTRRVTDVSPQVLYTLEDPVPIGTSGKEYITAGYTNPEGGSVISAFDVIKPVAYTDYEFNSAEDGSGTDLTANVATTISPVWFPSANGFTIGFFNKGAPGFLVFLQVRGKGIYKYNPIEIFTESLESKENFVRTEISDSLTREYSSDLVGSKIFADHVVALRRHPSKNMLSASFHANQDERLLLAFLYLEQGDKVYLEEYFPANVGQYFIQGVKFRIEMGGTIDFTWTLQDDTRFVTTPIAVHAPVDGITNRVALDFNALPQVANLPFYSFSFWIKRTDAGVYPYAFGPIIGKSVDDGTGRRGHHLLLISDRFSFTSHKTVTDGRWETGSIMTTVNQWKHVVLTYDSTSAANDPQIYFNGVLQALTEAVTPAGITDLEGDASLLLFNIGPNPAVDGQNYYYDVVHDFALKNVRIYDKILSAAEIATLADANSENNYVNVQDGLVFHGIFAPSSNIADYVGDEIENEDLVLEIMYGAAGRPYSEDPAKMLTGASYSS